MTTEDENRLLLTDAFWRLAQRVFARGTMTDVVYWVNSNGYARIAFVGDPLKMASTFGLLDGVGETSPYLGGQIGRAIRSEMGVPLTQHELLYDWENQVVGLGDLLDRLSGQTAWQWVEAHQAPIGDEGVRVGFIPEPGYPWPAEGNRYWSAKQRKWLPSKEPGWLIQVESRDEPGVMVPGVNPCVVFPPDETKTKPGGPICGELNGAPLMVTHAMQLLDPDEHGARHKVLDTAIAGIKGCGGLLFPSLAVGPIPATNFGPIVLVAHLELVLDSLLPYRRHKRRRPCWVYGTDAWTATTSGLLRETALELFDELHGDDHWIGRHISTLGLPASTSGSLFAHQDIEPLKNTKQLASSLKKHMRGWSSEMDFDDFMEKATEATGDDRYAYVEAKAREVVRLEEFPFLIAPKHLKPVVAQFVKGVGYKGKVILLDMDALAEWDAEPMETDERNWYLYQWAWQVSDAVRGLRPIVRVET